MTCYRAKRFSVRVKEPAMPHTSHERIHEVCRG